MRRKDDELLTRLDAIIALMEEQAHYLSLLLSGDETPEPEPSPPPSREPLSEAETARALVSLLADYLNANPQHVGPPERPRVILPLRISVREM